MDNFARNIKQQAAFFEKCKKALTPKFMEAVSTDDKLKFFRMCDKEGVLAFPIFSKVVDGGLLIHK